MTLAFKELDAFVESYATEIFTEGCVGNNIMCSVMHRVPSMSSQFPSVRRALKGWSRQSSTKEALPFTRQLALGLIGYFANERENSLALCVAIMWGGLLRAREALALEGGDIALPGDPRLADCPASVAGVLVRDAKTGRMQVSIVDEPLICQFLTSHLSAARCRRHGPLFDISYPRLLDAMRSAVTNFGLNASSVSTHSCRHGGALTLYLRGMDATTIASRGRWASVRTLERYLANGRARHLDL